MSRSRILKTGENQITQSYRQHYDKVHSGNGWAIGVDVVKKTNQCDSIIAHTDGTVIKVMDKMTGTNCVHDPEGMGYGNYVMIQHKDNYVTLYAHLASVAVKQGQKVSKRTVIGYMGNTGYSYGAHVHFEVRKYKINNPMIALHDNTKFEWLNPEPFINSDLPGNNCATSIVGYLDVAKMDGNDKIFISGWAYGGSQNVKIRIFNSNWNFYLYNLKANQPRIDVLEAGYPTDKVGFSDTYPVSLLNGTYNVEAYVDNVKLTNTKQIVVKKELAPYSYSAYANSSNDYYRVRTSFTNEKSSKGSFHSFTLAYNEWSRNKTKGYHIYDKNGKQLD
jgi:hypothetical protein